MKIGKEILSHVTEMYRKLRNTLFKFVLSNVSDFDFSKDKVYDNDEVNNLVLSQLEENLATINKAYENFDFISVMETVLGHVIELSTGYFDTIKDTLYCDEANNPNRRAVQTVLYHVLTSYLFALAPVLPHTCEEVYSFLKVNDKLDSVFLVDMQSESYATNYKFTHQEVNKQK
jgi:isoleucyl-tRNA synthetase